MFEIEVNQQSHQGGYSPVYEELALRLMLVLGACLMLLMLWGYATGGVDEAQIAQDRSSAGADLAVAPFFHAADIGSYEKAFVQRSVMNCLMGKAESLVQHTSPKVVLDQCLDRFQSEALTIADFKDRSRIASTIRD